MNLIDAVRSGKPFRCKSSTTDFGRCWWRVSGEHGFFTNDRRGADSNLLASEVIADDWEIQEPEVRVTTSQFWEAAEGAFGFKVKATGLGVIGYTGNKPPPAAELSQLAKRLGLEG